MVTQGAPLMPGGSDWAKESTDPQLVSGYCRPRPRKSIAASVMMLEATARVVATRIGRRALGSICRNIIRELLTPTARAASVYSAERRVRNDARNRRATYAQPKKARIRITSSTEV